MPNVKHVGFTGTSKARLTPAQAKQLAQVLAHLWLEGFTVAHHGDCINADAEFAELAKAQGFKVVAHPGPNEKYRAHSPHNDEIWPVAENLDRNADIINVVDLMLACPFMPREERRSGTWATCRYTGKKNRRLRIIYPDGTEAEYPNGYSTKLKFSNR